MHVKRLCAALGAAAALVLAPGFASGAGTQFGAPVKVTPTGGHGYEPAVYTDRFR